MGFSIKELQYKQRYLLYLTEQELAGPWFSFKLKGKSIGTIPVILKNIEPTPIYKIVNTKKGTNIDVFSRSKVPYINAYFTLKNASDFNLIDFSIYFIFDFDVNGLEGFDNDLSGFDKENDIIFQYDKTGLHAGFSTISKPTHYETCLKRDFTINYEKLNLSNKLHDSPGDILSALQIEFQTLEPDHSFQTALTISGGDNKEELTENIVNGKKDAIKYLGQVYRSIKSEQRNLQEESFMKLNLQQALDCNKK